MTTPRTRRRARALAAGLAAAALGGLVAVAAPQAAVAATEDPYCRTTEGTHDFYPGPSASATYDATFHDGVAVPAGLLDNHYTPQGLAYWNDWNGTSEDVLLISAYHDANSNKVPDGPSAIFGVVLSGPNRGDSLGRMLIPTTHAGGIAVVGGHVYVAGEGIVRWWSTAGVRHVLEAANTDTTHGYGTHHQNVAGRASFLGTQGGTLWTGNFDGDDPTDNPERAMWQYRPNADGTLTSLKQKRPVPGKTQGMTTVGSRFVFATSEGRGDRGNVWVRPTSLTGAITDGTSFCMRAPSMIEGLAYGVSNGNAHVWALYESGAATYRGSARNPITTIHWAEGSTLAGLYGKSD